MNIKVPFCFLLFLVVMLLEGINFSQEALVLPKSDVVVAITAGEYCLFLNAVAATDPDHLYEEKMGSSCSQLILRTGKVGSYHYQVVAGREEVPISFINKLSAASYLNWLQDPSLVLVSTILSITCDEELQSMSSHFYFIKGSSLASIQQDSAIKERSFLENAVIGTVGIGMLLVAGREMMTRDVPAERGHPQWGYSPERLQEREAASVGLLHGIKGTSATFEGQPAVFPTFPFKNLPQDILREAIFGFFSPKMPGELGGCYKQECEKALIALRTTDLRLVEQVVSWQEAYQAWLSAAEEQKVIIGQRVQEIEENLPPEVYAMTTFYRTREIMNQFQSFQEKWLHLLKDQKEGQVPYHLLEATKINDILIQATNNIKALLEVVQICQQKSNKEEIKVVPFITEQYKTVISMISHAIEEYASLTGKIETKDAQAIRSFFKEREQRQATIIKKPAFCSSLLNYYQRKEHCRELLFQSNINNSEIGWNCAAIDFCFSKVTQATSATSYYAQALLEQAGSYFLQRMEEIAAFNRVTQKAKNLSRAASVAKYAGETFEEKAEATTSKGKIAYKKALNYYLRATEEIAVNGFTEGAEILDSMASAIRGAGESFEKATRAISSHAKMAFEKAENYYATESLEILINNCIPEESKGLKSIAANVATTAGEVFEEAAKATSSQAKMALEQAGDYYLQEAREIAINGFTEELENLNSIANAARKAGEAFERAAKTTSSSYAKMAFEKEGETHYQIVKDLEKRNKNRRISRIISDVMKMGSRLISGHMELGLNFTPILI